MDSKLWILLNPVTDKVQKHSETALDAPKKEGAESSFPIKMHLIPGETPAICKFLWCKCGAKPKRKIANPRKSKICDLMGARSRFGQIKYDNHFKRFSYRGKRLVSAEFATIAVAHNIRKMIAKGYCVCSEVAVG